MSRRTRYAILALVSTVTMSGLLVLINQIAFASSQGPFSGTSVSGSWSNLTLAEACDSTNASLYVASGTVGAALTLEGYGFTVPSGSTIGGIQVSVTEYAASGAHNIIQDSSVQLIVGGTATGSNLASTSQWPTSLSAVTYGSSTTLWGLTPTAAQIDATDFGVSIAPQNVYNNHGGASSEMAYIDCAQITITYTAPAYSLNQAAYQFYDNGTPSYSDGSSWGSAITATAFGSNPRQLMGAAVFNGDMYVMGGWQPGATPIYYNDVYKSSDGSSWSVVNNGSAWPSGGMYGMSVLVFQNKLWVIGGETSSGYSDSVYSSTDGNSWSTVTSTPGWTGRAGMAAFVYNNKMWIMGGYDSTASYKQDVWYSSDGSSWTQVTTLGTMWAARNEMGYAVFNNAMWIYGGGSASANYNDAWYSTDGATWTEATSSGCSTSCSNSFTPSFGMGSVAYGGRLWTFGGYGTGGASGEVWCSSDGTTWSDSTSGSPACGTGAASWTGRTNLSALVYDQGLWVMGGGTTSYSTLDDVYESPLPNMSVGSSLAAVDTAITSPGDSQPFRLRVDVGVSGANMSANIQNFKLQFAQLSGGSCSATTGFADVTDTSVVRYYSNTPAYNGQGIDSTYPTDPASPTGYTAESYQQAGTTSFTDPYAITNGYDGVWDFALTTYDAPGSTSYCLKVINGSGSDLSSYAYYPEITTPASTVNQSNYRFFQNNDGPAAGWDNGNWPRSDGAVGLSFGGKLWYIGGYHVGDGTYSNQVWYSTDGSTWTAATLNAPWAGREYAAGVVFNNEMWIMGGRGSSGVLNDVWYSTDGVTWTEATASAGWLSGDGMAYAVYNNTMYVMGGTDGWDDYRDVFSSADGSTWTNVTHNPPWSGRWNESMLSYNNKLWVMGGYTGSGYLNDVWYSTDGVTWTEATASAGWAARSQATVMVFNNEMWIMGGVGAADYGDAWYSTDGVTWTQASTGTNATTALTRYAAIGMVYNNEMWLMGGNNAGALSDVWYSTDGSNWTEATASAGWGPREYAAGTVFNGKMWLMGGTDATNAYNDVWYSTDGSNWTEATASAGWGGRESFVAVNYNNKLWVMGGYDRQVSGEAAYYQDVWTTTDGISWSQGSAPPWDSRSRMASTVFNNRIWLAGGYNGGGNGSTYFEYRDVWSYAPGPDVGAAEARQNKADDLFGTSITPPAPVVAAPVNQPFRLRWLINVGGSAEPKNNLSLDLQYAEMSGGSCSATPIGNFANVTTTTPLQFYTGNSIAANGMALMVDANDPTDGSNNINYQTYVSANPFTNSQSDIPGNEDGLWDFALVMTPNPPHDSYCLRAVYSSGGGMIDTYNTYPQVNVAPTMPELLRGRSWWNSSGIRQFKAL